MDSVKYVNENVVCFVLFVCLFVCLFIMGCRMLIYIGSWRLSEYIQILRVDSFLWCHVWMTSSQRRVSTLLGDGLCPHYTVSKHERHWWRPRVAPSVVYGLKSWLFTPRGERLQKGPLGELQRYKWNVFRWKTEELNWCYRLRKLIIVFSLTSGGVPMSMWFRVW